MKKFLLFLVTLLFAVGAWAQTPLNVGPGQTYTTIQAAINAAVDGDIIQIDAGLYNEVLTVNKSLTLIGSGPSNEPTTIIKPAAGRAITLTVTNKSYSLQNLIIEGNGANQGIRAAGNIDVNLLELKDVIVKNWQYGLYFAELYSGDAFQPTFISVLDFDNVTLIDNNTIGAYIGKAVLNGEVKNSTIKDNGFAIDNNTQKVGLQFVDFAESLAPKVTVTNSTFINNGTGTSTIERTGLAYYTAIDFKSPDELLTVSNCTFEDHPLYTVRIRNKYSVGNEATINGTFTNNYLDIWFNNVVGFTTSTTLVRNTFIGIRTVGAGPTYDYNTIQDAIDAANEGDVINVYPGYYLETRSGATGPTDGGIFIQTPGITLQGVDANGNCYH
jgi:hypothetical protein